MFCGSTEVDPFVQGLSEGTYRAFAELVGEDDPTPKNVGGVEIGFPPNVQGWPLITIVIDGVKWLYKWVSGVITLAIGPL